MPFYKSSHRSTLLDCRAKAKLHNDHDNRNEDEGLAPVSDHYRDHGDPVLEEIARAARAEADAAIPGHLATTPNARLSPFETELLWAWSEK